MDMASHADGFGVPTAPETPAGLVAIVVVATLALTFAVTYIPGHRAARTQARVHATPESMHIEACISRQGR